jgi:hypothetical protein
MNKLVFEIIRLLAEFTPPPAQQPQHGSIGFFWGRNWFIIIRIISHFTVVDACLGSGCPQDKRRTWISNRVLSRSIHSSVDCFTLLPYQQPPHARPSARPGVAVADRATTDSTIASSYFQSFDFSGKWHISDHRVPKNIHAQGFLYTSSPP